MDDLEALLLKLLDLVFGDDISLLILADFVAVGVAVRRFYRDR